VHRRGSAGVGGGAAVQNETEREVSAAKLAALREFITGCGGGETALDGWTARTETRRGGSSSGATDTYFFSPPPDEQRFRSRQEVVRHLGLEANRASKRKAEEVESGKRAAASAAAELDYGAQPPKSTRPRRGAPPPPETPRTAFVKKVAAKCGEPGQRFSLIHVSCSTTSSPVPT